MSRNIDSATAAASQADTILPIAFVKLEFDSAHVNLHTSLGNIIWGGDTYVGAGDIGGIGAVDEDTELSRSTLQLTLRGLPNDIVAIVMGEHYQGRSATIYLSYLNITTRQLVADPVIVYRGRMDTAAVQQGDNYSVTLNVENRFAAWDRPLIRRYNNADQQSRFPGDKGLEFVEQTTEKNLVWGQKYAN